MRRRKRGFQQFSLSFLDCMSCGLGAVILLFMVINHSTEVRATDSNRDVADKVSALETEVLERRQARRQLAAALEETERKLRAAKAQAASLEEAVDDGPKREKSSDDKAQRIASLQQELKNLEAAVEELSQQQTDEGDATRSFTGDGNRQYLTGLKVGGQHILILVDASASMLGETILSVIRRRNMDTADKLRSAKWRRALRTVDWITTQVPAGSKFQLYTFNTDTKAVLSGTDGSWQSAAGGAKLNAAVQALRKVVPSGGTSLVSAFSAASRLSPAPDSIFLIIDSLPTQGAKIRGGTVDGNQRARYYREALNALPRGVPVNVILFPMEGDPLAPSAYWQLALASGGSFLSPTEDWP